MSITTATGGATIHYTTDGSTPTANSPTYSSPIYIKSRTTLRAVATKNGEQNSGVASASYTVKGH